MNQQAQSAENPYQHRNSINTIVGEVTHQFRKGEEVTHKKRGDVTTTEIFAMPHESEVAEGVDLVDVHFLKVGIHREAAEKNKGRFEELIRNWPTNPEAFKWTGQPFKISEGPSYIHLGAFLGDQGRALQFMALGKYYGMWDFLTPEKLMGPGAPQDLVERMYGGGFFMIDPSSLKETNDQPS